MPISHNSSTPERRRYFRGVFFILLGTLLWSTGGVGVKWLTGGSVELPPFLVSAGRSTIAALVFLAVARGRILPPRGRSAGWFWMGAVAYAMVVTGFVLSTFLTTAANAIILQDIMPLWVLILSKPMLGERPRPREFIAMVIGLAGVALCMRQGFAAAGPERVLSLESAGDIIALAAGFMFAIVAICMRKFGRETVPGEKEQSDATAGFLFFGNLLAALIGVSLFVGFNFGDSAAAMSSVQWGLPVLAVLIWLGVFQLGGGYLAAGRGMAVVPAFQASVLMLGEPVLNPLWVAIAIGEVPGPETLLGGALILGAMVVALGGKREAVSRTVN